MKKYIGLAIIMAFVFSSALVVNAEESTTTTATNNQRTEREAFRETLRTRRDVFKTEVQTKREEFRKANLEKKREFWEKSKRMIGERFEVAAKNLERIQERVGKIIDEFKTAGKDTILATEALNQSKTKLTEAKAKIAEVKALIPENGEKITAEIFEQIKLKAREAKDLLKESHNSLKEAVQALKNLREDKNDDSEDAE